MSSPPTGAAGMFGHDHNFVAPIPSSAPLHAFTRTVAAPFSCAGQKLIREGDVPIEGPKRDCSPL